ncbi:subtilisin-like protein [Mycena galopus ATCC 62051]|nr:subtilisin-like protein [Mycena galopus ATCC 62051]
MMALRSFLSVLSLSAASAMVLIESRPEAPAGFVSQGATPAADVLNLRFALAANNIAGLEAKLGSLSTPGSPDFRQWLSADEVKAFVHPSAETTAAFAAFASANGLNYTVISPNGDWVSLSLPVSHANTLFAANFETFTHPDITGTISRTLSVSLPSELAGHVDVIHPTTEFIVPPQTPLVPAPAESYTVEKRGPPSSCNTTVDSGVITPSCLQQLYGIPTTPATQRKNTLMVTGYGEQWAQTADLSAFLKLVRPDIPSNTTFTLLTTVGGKNQQGPGDAGSEANLDIQYTIGIATGVPTEFLSVGGANSEGGFFTALDDMTTYIDGLTTVPSVITTSYGAPEYAYGITFATKLCSSYMAFGARGISVIYASGDGGVRGNHDDSTMCSDNNFIPVFPASCPYVTSVGSTIGFAPEVSANFSSGGFSNFFPSPSYQTAAVAGFLETVPSNFAGTFNRTGRGFPDVAVQGLNFQIVNDGAPGLIGGTSASAPTFAAIIALINDRLLAAGKPVLGFLNPLIYSTGSKAFTDVTAGHNSGFVCPASSVAFDAAVGWDPLTGFGTPRFADLLTAALA